MIEKLPEELRAAVVSNQSLRRYLNSLNKDKDFTPPSWLWDGKHGNPKLDLSSVLEKWKGILATLSRGTEFEKNVYTFDLDSESKWGPQGGHPPISEIMDEIVLPTFKRAASKNQKFAFDDDLWQQAKREVILEFNRLGIANLRPMSLDGAIKYILQMHADRLSSNSGFPDFSRRKIPEIMHRAVEDAKSGAYLEYPAVLLFRRYRGKTRMVWMFPFSANLVEATYYLPLFNSMLKKRQLTEGFFAPWTGFEGVRKLVSKVFGKGGTQIAASDFSATDEHFTWDTTSEVADVLEALFQKEYRSGLRDSLQHMHEIPLLVSQDQYITGKHGVSSGSMWTNFVETVFDYILAKYEELKSKGKVKGLYAIGDDMAHVVDEWDEDEFNPWLERLGESVGQEIKREKTMLKPGKVKTLQRLFQAGYKQENSEMLRGVYPTIRALNSLLYPERMHPSKQWNFDMFAVRTFMILENCVDHPLFADFVKFVCEGNPRLLAWAKQANGKLESAQRAAKLLPGLVPTYNQEKKDVTIVSFLSINVVREML